MKLLLENWREHLEENNILVKKQRNFDNLKDLGEVWRRFI